MWKVGHVHINWMQLYCPDSTLMGFQVCYMKKYSTVGAFGPPTQK